MHVKGDCQERTELPHGDGGRGNRHFAVQLLFCRFYHMVLALLVGVVFCVPAASLLFKLLAANELFDVVVLKDI